MNCIPITSSFLALSLAPRAPLFPPSPFSPPPSNCCRVYVLVFPYYILTHDNPSYVHSRRSCCIYSNEVVNAIVLSSIHSFLSSLAALSDQCQLYIDHCPSCQSHSSIIIVFEVDGESSQKACTYCARIVDFTATADGIQSLPFKLLPNFNCLEKLNKLNLYS